MLTRPSDQKPDAAMQTQDDASAGLLAAVAALRQDSAGAAPRDQVLGLFRRHLARIQQQVRDEFETYRMAGVEAAQRLTALSDGVVRALFAHAVAEIAGPGGLRDQVGIAATGGYGRMMLAPFSDIDLLFLAPDEPEPVTLRVIEFMLYFMWDLGLKVGHATRSIAHCLADAEEDLTIRTSLMDARLLAGDADLFASFQAAYDAARQQSGPGAFITAKQAERQERHRRFGESAFLVEPNIKEGRGGLRDLQTLYWMVRAAFGQFTPNELVAGSLPLLDHQELRRLRRSWDFLWTVRFHMHYVSGRAEDRLTFDLQPVVGARMGYTRHGRQDGVERFMRHYFLTARDVTRLTRVLEPAVIRETVGEPALQAEPDRALLEAGFVLADGMIKPLRGEDFETQPILMLRMLKLARDRKLALHPLAMRSLIRHERRAVGLRGNAEAGEIFLDLICGMDADGKTHGARWLSIMNESGIIGRMLPDWARIVGQMQFDTYHIFTVDEHTIEAVRILNKMERGRLLEVAPVASGLLEDLQSRRSLYMAALLHDIAKGRGGDHSILGAEIAMQVGPQLGLTAEETETVSWLVLHHLLLSQTAFKRDIDDPKTIMDLAETVQSPERLKLLLVLTVADMRAVSPRVWNGWKATLLREIYARVAEVLAGGLSTTERDVRVKRARAQADEVLTTLQWPDADRAFFLGLGYPGYWLSFDPDTHVRHARMVRDAEARHAPLTVETEPLPARAVTEVTVYAADHAGLFSRIAGALAVAGASIVDARIHTLTNGMALDTFWVQDAAGGAFDQPHRLAKLYVLVEQALSGHLRLDKEIPKLTQALMARRMRAIHVPPRVVIDNRASNSYTVLEVNGRDRPGLLHDVTFAISEQGLQIGSAHVSTYGVRAVDVFYVKDVFGLKVENERKLATLRDALLAALSPPGDAEGSAAPSPGRPRRADAA
jgi:[protein-PII] uridylyltransferase